jgi:hypothetical protein
MKANRYLHELQQTFDIMEDCFIDGLMFLAKIPQEFHLEAFNFCKEFLHLLENDLNSFGQEVLHMNISQFSQKRIGKENLGKKSQNDDFMSELNLVKEVKRGLSLVRSDLYSEYGSPPSHALRHLNECDEYLGQLERKLNNTTAASAGGNHA